MERLVTTDPRNALRIKPFIGGEEVNNSPTHSHHRYAIDFFDLPLERVPEFQSWSSWSEERVRRGMREGRVPMDYPFEVAEDWSSLVDIVRRRVKPGRDNQTRDALRIRWWQYAEKRPGLYRNIRQLSHVLSTNCGAAPHLAFGRMKNGSVYAHTLAILAYPNLAPFAVLQSRVHEIWARFFSSTLEDRLRYAPSDCFETFPFPPGYETDSTLELEDQTYHDHRAALMVAADEGMTKTYNRFHKPDERGEAIETLRRLHDEMDRAVLRAYGWHDLADLVRPQFLTEDTEDDHTYQKRYFWPADQRDMLLARLLALNAERHAQEVAEGITPNRSRVSTAEEDAGDSGLD